MDLQFGVIFPIKVKIIPTDTGNFLVKAFYFLGKLIRRTHSCAYNADQSKVREWT